MSKIVESIDKTNLKHFPSANPENLGSCLRFKIIWDSVKYSNWL